METIKDSLPKYVVNFDELTDTLKKDLLDLINKALKDKYPQVNSNNLETALRRLESLLPNDYYKGLKSKIDKLIYRKIEGIVKIEGIFLDVPPLIMTTKHDFIFEKDIFITGLQIDQTGWKKQDKYSLEIEKNKIINNATTKEIGEHKYFNTYFKVNANTPVSFSLRNNSGNSRQTLVDLEYIEGNSVTVTPRPPSHDIGVEDIPNDWDIAVVMNWENSSLADLDLHGYMNGNHVYFNNRDIDDSLYLNFDYQSHIGNSNPEIISVKGHEDSQIKIYVHNYNGANLTQPISIKVYHKTSYGVDLLQELNPIMGNDRNYLIGICVIDLGSLSIVELSENIRTINGGI